MGLMSFSLILSFCLVFLSSSWMIVWMGLELNLISFVSIIALSSSSSESPMKYFLVQSCASISFLQMILILPQKLSIFLLLPLGLKAGVAPFHFWFPVVSNSLSWNSNIVLMTAQKLIPLYLIFLLKLSFNLLSSLALVGVLVGALGGLNESSLRKILAFSSISHMGWILCAMTLHNSVMIFYLVTYLLMTWITIESLKNINISWLNEISTSGNIFEISVNFLSLSGFPPFLGFFPKWLILIFLGKISLTFSFILATSGILSLFFYLKMILLPLMSFMLKQNNTSHLFKGKIKSLSPALLTAGMPLMALASCWLV